MQYTVVSTQLYGSLTFSTDGSTILQPVMVTIGVVGDTYGKAIWNDLVNVSIPSSSSITDAAAAVATFAANYVATTYPNT